MKKTLLIAFGIFLLAFSACNEHLIVEEMEADTSVEMLKSGGAITSADFLKTNGTFIRNNYGNGSNVYLRGTNAGGWLVQEEWMCATNAPDQKTMMNTFESRFGKSARNNLISIYENNYWTSQDFDNCANMGMTAIRLPFTYMNLMKDDWSDIKTGGWDRLDWFIENCRIRGMYVILDLHGAFGSQNGMDHSGEVNDGYQFYWNDYHKSMTKWLWWQIANRYKGNPTVAAYDILNEPGIKGGLTTSLQWDFYDEVYDVIRSVDSDHIIIMESCWDAAQLPHPNVYGWTNVVYEYHYYPWDYVNDYNGQVNFVNSKINDIANAGYNVPTYVGEFNCFGLANAWEYTLNAYNNEGWHYTSWTYKALGNNTSWGIYNHNPSRVDIYNNSKKTIRNKWRKVGASNSWRNNTVYDAMVEGLKGTAVPNGEYYFKGVSTNKIISADNGGNDPLVANRSSYGGAWETFTVVHNSDGTISLKSEANGKYVCAVHDEDNRLIARSSGIGAWEKFYIEKITSTQFALKSSYNNKYVTINQEASNVLYATADAVNLWEVMYIYNTDGTQIMD
ncbi:Cellulase (glycosyl hydrolase family 5) [Saccharicrinis carchari]|uniref:Cellulase (Glycosyl hydrolase family 5) n=1 Tax=Saccharicrinis carchari TaxID=1168039 RepID=A0A521AZK7_SACCC|nr:cellulase family glycosylhydrolase [Saccharicrinis carchari]SMO40278.1 Cellulase (glycosyl hydrolase family 5) [Saccharicrinis carchari]